MLKSKNFRFWFIIFAIQLLLACVVPAVIFLLIPAADTPVNLEIAGLSIEKTASSEVKDILLPHLETIAQSGEVVLESDGVLEKIPYYDFEVRFDAEDVLESIEKSRYANRFFQIIGKANPNKSQFVPNVYFNEAKLRKILNEKADLFIKEAKDAGMILTQDQLSIAAHENGLKINVDSLTEHIMEWIKREPSSQILISQETVPSVFHVVEPELTMEYLREFTQVYHSIHIKTPSDMKTQDKNFVERTKNLLIASGETFSFKEKLSPVSSSSFSAMMASAIHEAVLPLEGIRGISRNPYRRPVSGVEPGFDVNLEGDGDLRFQNETGQDLLLITQADANDGWRVTIVGKPGLTRGEIQTEKRTITPPVIYSQDNSLAEKEQRIVEPGEEGLSVKVFRVVQGETTELHEDIYPPLEKIIAIGTGVKKGEIIQK